MDYSKLSDFEINKLVFERKTTLAALSYPHNADKRSCGHKDINNIYHWFDFCNNPADAWPIIIENHIAVAPYQHTLPQAWPTAFGLVSKFTTEDKNPLRAAMITFLKMQESQNAKIPTERDS
ncbi:phage protein NinX family protein [Raoultella ornithinolytica]|uniref:phage protein NinX family protein n=1 Tax=Raoultella ornithinolytica TaxID=54291 RepID=UPI002FEF4281